MRLPMFSYRRILEYTYASMLNAYLSKLHMILMNLAVNGQIKEDVFREQRERETKDNKRFINPSRVLAPLLNIPRTNTSK